MEQLHKVSEPTTRRLPTFSHASNKGHALGILEANSPRGKFGVKPLCTVGKSNGEDNFNLQMI